MWITHESRAACGQLENHPTPLRGRPRTDPPGATPTSRPVRSGPAEGSLGRIPRGPPSGPSHHFRRGRRPGYRDPGLGHWARRRAQPALLALLRRRALLAPTRVVRTSARYIPLAVPTTRARAGRARAPRARNPPTPNNARPCGARHRLASPLGESPGLVPLPPGLRTATSMKSVNVLVWCPSPPDYAHKDPDLRNTRCTQRLDSALVCDPVFPNSLPCVRHQEKRAPRPVNPRPRQSQPRPRA